MNTSSFGENKSSVFTEVKKFLTEKNLKIAGEDQSRPWGGYFVISDHSLEIFISSFFPETELNSGSGGLKLSPKILLVEPQKRLSWQYHNFRSEIWSVIGGSVGVIISDTDQQNGLSTYQTGDTLHIDRGQRHRLVGLNEWGIIAEIWQHTDPAQPSSEEDIVRLEDDFGR
jgi:mannose-6-phosphate isomerase